MNFFYDKKHMLAILKGVTHREEIRKIIPLSYEKFVKTPFCENSSDMFGKSEMMIMYDKNDVLKEIEIYNPEADFFYFGHQLLGASVKNIKSILDEMSANYIIIEHMLKIQDTNLNMFIPDIETDSAILESVVISRSSS